MGARRLGRLGPRGARRPPGARRAGRRPEDVDLIILGTDSPDYITPATSVVVQEKLGAKNAGTFDVGCACASFPTGFAAAAGLIATNPGLKTVLVIGVYLMHKLADPDDPMIFFYGDGAGAAVLEPRREPGFVNAAFQADGAYAGYWGSSPAAPPSRRPRSRCAPAAPGCRWSSATRPEINHEGWPRLVRRLADEGRLRGGRHRPPDLHPGPQADSIELVMADLGLPLERTHTVMEEWGYTGSACVPMALHDAREKGKIQPGDLVVLVGSGVGYNQAAVAFRA